MKNSIFMLLVLILLTFASQAQSIKNSLAPPSINDLQQTTYAADSSAAAVVLIDQTVTQYTDYTTIDYNRCVRIKILRPEGLNALDTSATPVAVYQLKGQQVTTVSSDKIKVGCIVDYIYQHQSTDYRHIESWRPQREIPVMSALYTLVTPIGYELEIDHVGDCGQHMTRRDTIKTPLLCLLQQYEASNIKALSPDPWLYCIQDYRFSLTPHINKISFPDETVENCVQKWSDVDSQMLKSPLFSCLNDTDSPIYRSAEHLKAEGKKVLPVAVRKRSSGRIQLSYPDANIFDYLVLCVISNHDTTFIDPLQPDSIQHLLPRDLRTIQARMIEFDKKGKNLSCWVNLFSKYKYKLIRTSLLNLDAQGNITGVTETIYRDYASLEHQNQHEEVNMHIDVTPDSIRFSPFINYKKEIQLPDSIRTLPVDYDYCYDIQHHIVLNIDPAFEFSSYPRSSYLISNSRTLGAQIRMQINDHRIEYSIHEQQFILSQLPSANELVHNFYNSFEQLLKQQICLRHKN